MTIQDGTETFKGDQVTGDKLDVTVGWHGTTLPVNPTNEVPTNGLFLLTATDGANSPGWYENTGTVAAPVFTLRAAGGADPDPFGDGSDGAATNPALSPTALVPIFKNYTDLTISANTTWAGTGILIVKCSGTFDLQATFTLTINTDSSKPFGVGGVNTDPGIGDGGDGGVSRATVIIIAKSIIGTGTIVCNGANGTVGESPGVGDTTISSHVAGTDGGIGNHYLDKTNLSPGATAKLGVSTSGLVFVKIDDIPDLNQSAGVAISSGGGGASGSRSGSSGDPGGGGGGGGAAFLILITSGALPAITINMTGGNGGDGGSHGGNATNMEGGGGAAGGNTPFALGGNGGKGSSGSSGGGGGAGGGSVTIFKVGTSDGTTTNLTAGTGGDGKPIDGVDGTAGITKDLFVTWNVFKKRIGAGI